MRKTSPTKINPMEKNIIIGKEKIKNKLPNPNRINIVPANLFLSSVVLIGETISTFIGSLSLINSFNKHSFINLS